MLLLCSYAYYVLMAGVESVFGMPALRREVQWVMDERAANHGGPDRGWRDPEAL